MSFLEHLEELRSRILKILIATAIAFAACFAFSDELFRIVARPITALVPELVFTTVTEPFNLTMKIALLAAIFLASPFIMAQVWLFISPGLYRHERRYALPFILSSSLLFVTGGVFGYFIGFPYTLKFLVDWGRGFGLKEMLTAAAYFDTFIMVELGLGLVFQIPAVIFVLSRIGLITPQFLVRNSKYAVLLSFVAAAVITPSGDAMTMMVFAVPIILLYFLGVIVAFIFGKKRTKE